MDDDFDLDDDFVMDDDFDMILMIAVLLIVAIMIESESQVQRTRVSYNRVPNLQRNRDDGQLRLDRDYFAPNAVYSQREFHRRFRMTSRLFNKIENDIENFDSYFVQKTDCVGVKGFTARQKCAAALRMLAYGTSADACDEYLRMAESTALETHDRFCQAIFFLYKDQYLRNPNKHEQSRLIFDNSQRGFPGMLGSLDCTHWYWKNCPQRMDWSLHWQRRCPDIGTSSCGVD